MAAPTAVLHQGAVQLLHNAVGEVFLHRKDLLDDRTYARCCDPKENLAPFLTTCVASLASQESGELRRVENGKTTNLYFAREGWGYLSGGATAL
eukprot:6037987-Lingulodinium_polyedra.AAC.1